MWNLFVEVNIHKQQKLGDVKLYQKVVSYDYKMRDISVENLFTWVILSAEKLWMLKYCRDI